ncbi:HMG domain-containing protein 3-like [Paramisgurnus dabryanus]|uniref:HMG domain-containing protein 3-like n=1 Tax=Paramisgurnus dabryanus TaxID=90735 RepID=UPI0031F474E7
MVRKKECWFPYAVSEVPDPTDYTGEVNLRDFWESLSLNIISLGFVKVGEENPFVVKPTFGFWAPWIGPETRKSDVVLNTEWEKVHRPAKTKEQAELDITEDRLLEEVMKMKVDDVKKLCKACGVDPCGSKTDLILRLHNEIRSRSTYDKIFEKIWGASGGWSAVMCPCGVVYSLKFNMRAESPRDYVDILLSWQHLPNVTIYDFARGLATHGNLRDPLMLPFAPHEGRLLCPTEENISLAKEGEVKVNLPWLTEPRNPPDINGHPTTGSSEHYVLYDKLHETNAKDPKDFLRRTALVPELAGKVNTQVVEQFFSQMEKNNYFLNMMAPSSQIFLIRNIVHHHNTQLNTSRVEKIEKLMGTRQTFMNKNGQLIIGLSQDIPNADTIKVLQKDEAITKLQNVSASSRCWQHPLNAELQDKVSRVLDEAMDPKEHIVRVYGETLTREDFLTLGLQKNVEAMILNSCLRVIAQIGSIRNIDI